MWPLYGSVNSSVWADNVRPMDALGIHLKASILKVELQDIEEYLEKLVVLSHDLAKDSGERLLKVRRALAVINRYEIRNGCGND